MGFSILLVDDSKFIRKGIAKELSNILADKTLNLTEAANGKEALEHLFTTSFDLVLLDLTMPEKNGYEVLEALKEKGIRTNIIVLTADIQPEAEKIVKKLGALAYIKKERPLNMKPLQDILTSIGILSTTPRLKTEGLEKAPKLTSLSASSTTLDRK
ncbi:response regulator [Desulfobacter latus]|uniref:Response regulator n=1 Tax=Desulfobacter latus TaxID=2292 RepID=A0A850T4P9_9BACT|nr:response regulator [Desulfobacter latus]NWH03815.1 response regulator [Desulfobacter latus]